MKTKKVTMRMKMRVDLVVVMVGRRGEVMWGGEMKWRWWRKQILWLERDRERGLQDSVCSDIQITSAPYRNVHHSLQYPKVFRSTIENTKFEPLSCSSNCHWLCVGLNVHKRKRVWEWVRE
jgi:hypothetical protein